MWNRKKYFLLFSEEVKKGIKQSRDVHLVEKVVKKQDRKNGLSSFLNI